MKLLFLLALAGALQACSGSRILAVVPIPAKSHFILGERIVQELGERGHDVTFIAPYKMIKPNKNVKELTIPDFSHLLQDSSPAINASSDGRFGMRHMNPLAFLQFGKKAETLMDHILEFKGVKDLISSNQKFDLVFGECFFTEAILAGFSHKFKAPIIGLATFMPNTWANHMVGNPAPAAYIPDPILGYTDKMTFFERVTNFLYTTLTEVNHYMSHLPGQEVIMKKHFGNDLPPLKDILLNTSAVLVNHHYSLAFPRPYLPNMIEIGGFHIKPLQPLPKNLQKFMDDAKDGVIFFSMGSNLRSAEFPQEKFQGILKAFSRLRQKVLWKFESENPPNLPANVKISKWLPQSDILAHPNVKVFITHGGLLSITEAVHRGVPVVGIPVFGDQPINMKYVERFGLGVKLNYDDIAEDTLYEKLTEVLNNPKYRNNMKIRSDLLKDVPMPPLETAMYWIEYVIRYNGAPQLRAGSQSLAWYQIYLLDVYAVILSVLLISLFISYISIKCVYRTLCGKKSQKVAPSKKKN